MRRVCGHGKPIDEECLVCGMLFRIDQRKDAEIAALKAEVAALRSNAMSEDEVTKEYVDDSNDESFKPVVVDTIITSTFKLSGAPWFPFTITMAMPAPGCTITLHADGKWEGSTEGLRAALAENSSWGGDASMRIMLWLLLRQMEADARFW